MLLGVMGSAKGDQVPNVIVTAGADGLDMTGIHGSRSASRAIEFVAEAVEEFAVLDPF